MATLLFSSCINTKQSVYFKTIQSDTTINGFVTNSFESKIVIGDRLNIVVTSLSSVEDEQFNKAAAVSTIPEMSGFLVEKDGRILLHRLGYVTAAGLSRKELALQLQNLLLPYMKDPIVNVGYVNHKITVMGAVGTPQVLNMPEEQLSIIEVLVKSGDVQKEGLKNKVMIIREEGTDKKVKFLNLEDQSIFTSPWFYVKPNDIVFVPSDDVKLKKEEKRQNLQNTLTLALSIFTFVLIIADRIFR
ncbi:MAG: polysaccharide biosynthesis/export family protein [Ferruginibacter sp.]